MKYDDMLNNAYADTMGMIEFMGQTVQLCDHMQMIDGYYYATAMVIDVRDQKLMKDAGIQSKFWPTTENPSGDHYMFLSEEHLKMAKPKFPKDKMTQHMIARLIDALFSANEKAYERVA